jgi:hypothetical protein
MPVQLNCFAELLEVFDIRAVLLKLQDILQKRLVQSDGQVVSDVLNKLSRDVFDFVRYVDSQSNSQDVYARLEDSVLKLLLYIMLMFRDGLTAEFFGMDDIFDEVRSQWVSDDGVYCVVVLPKKDLNDVENLKVFVNEIMATYINVFGLSIGDVTSGQVVVVVFV